MYIVMKEVRRIPC